MSVASLSLGDLTQGEGQETRDEVCSWTPACSYCEQPDECMGITANLLFWFVQGCRNILDSLVRNHQVLMFIFSK